MKTTRKIFALLLCLAMVLGMATTAFATDITMTGGANNAVYSAYQLLNATDGGVDEEGNNLFAYTLNNKYADILKTVSEKDTQEEIIAYIGGLDANGIREFANAVYAAILKDAELTADSISNDSVFEGVAQGYYLIAESQIGEDWEDGVSDTHSLVMLDTAGKESIEVTTKEEHPTLDKEISNDDNDIDGDIAEIDGKNKHDNLSIGSRVQFTVTAYVPADAAYYDYYYFVINDTLSEGLTFINEDDYELTVSATGSVVPTYKLYTIDAENVEDKTYDNHTFEVAVTNAKALAGQTITVTYWAELNEKAVIGSIDGNPNTADVLFSNDPNYKYIPEDGPTPPKPAEDTDMPLGETPKQVTRTYTTGLKLIKTDENSKTLTGAEFTITGDNVVVTLVSKEVFTEAEDGEYYGLIAAEGEEKTYTKEAPRTEDEYVKAEAGATAGYVNIDNEWVEYNADEHAGKDIYILYKANADAYDGKKYNKEVVFEAKGETAESTEVKAFVGEDGTVVFKGLGEGEYTITESVVPEGYNKIDDIKVVISWSLEENATIDEKHCIWSVVATVDGEDTPLVESEDHLFELTVKNQSGSELPETGGIGTTLFYVFGSVMVLAAVILLVTKKRMSMAN